jgi:glucosamine kinase
VQETAALLVIPKPVLSARNLLAACSEEADSSRDIPRFGMTMSLGSEFIRPSAQEHRQVPGTSVSGNTRNSYGRTTLVAIYLGIDGGGSKTSCLIGDESSVLGAGTGGPSNVVRVGEAQARESLTSAIHQACTVANIEPSRIGSVCVGLAGAARPEISGLVRGIVSEIVSNKIKPAEIKVVGDMVIALEAAFGNGAGVIVIAGTGSIAYGRNHEGQTARAGGWGFAISDEGSGYWIGRTAVASAFGAWDENPGQTVPLIEFLLKFWHLETIEQLVPAANATPPPDFAALFPSVLSLANSGDRIARDVLSQAGAHLAALAGTLLRRLFPNSEAVPVAMSGGVFASSALVRQVFYNTLSSTHPNAALNPTVIEPVRGALALARQSAAK